MNPFANLPSARRLWRSPRKARSGVARVPRGFRPTLESLEDRCVPSVTTLFTQPANVNQTVVGGPAGSDLTNIIRISGTNLGGFEFANDITSSTPTVNDYINLVAVDQISNYTEVGGNAHRTSFGNNTVALIYAMQAQVTSVTVSGGVTNVSVNILGGALGLYPIPASNYDPLHVAQDGPTDAATGLTFNNPLALYTLNSAANVVPGLDGEGDLFTVDQLNQGSPNVGTPSLSQQVVLISTTNSGGFITSLPGRNVTSLVGLSQAQIQANGATLSGELTTADQNALNTIFSHLVPGANTLSKFANFGGGGATDFTVSNDGSSGDVIQSFNINSDPTGEAPDVDITKKADNPTITAGQTAGFTVTIFNEGQTTATGVTLTDPLPAGTGGDVNWSIDGTTGNPADFAITGSPGHQSLVLSASFLANDTLAPGASISVHITSPTNGADTSATTFTGTLPNTATVNDDQEAAPADQASATITILAPDVDITKKADNSTITAGQTAGFTVTITNEGLATATGIVLSDPLPAGTGGDVNWSIDGTTGNPADFAITGSLGSQSLVLSASFLATDTLAAGASISVHITSPTNGADTSATTFTGTLPNTATVTAPNQAGGETSDQASATITILAPDVDITKKADNSPITAGQTAGFTVTITNEGLATATGLVLSDPLPAGTGGDVNWSIDSSTGNPADFAITGSPGNQSLVLSAAFLASDTLAAGASISVHITSPTNGADTSATTFTGTLPNTATVTAPNQAGGETSDQSSATITILAPDVDITKTADNSPITAGQTAGFTVTITNEGLATATGIVLSDPLPAGTGGDVNWSIDSTTGNPTDFAITGSLGHQSLVLSASFLANDTLAAGASISVHITSPTNGADTSATTFTGTLPNTATVTAPNQAGGETSDQSSATITILAPDVDITKTADNSPITAGQTAGFTVTITNEGLATATGIVLSDPLPAGTGGDVNWSIDTSTGNPADFAITGSLGHQSLVLSASFLATDTLAAGASISVHITSPTNGADTSATTFTGTLPNTATVTAPNQAGGETSDKSSATITILAPDVDITKTADNSPITAGQTAGFTITIFNEGLATATGIALSDPLPAGTGGDVNWTIDTSTGNSADFAITGSLGHQSLVLSAAFLANNTLAAGASISVHLTSPTNTGDAPGGTGTLPNTATVTAPNQAGGETSDKSSATITITTGGTPVSAGEFATIGFWHNKNGQAVINSFNGSSSSTLLGNWLATNFPKLFGASNPYTGTSLAGLTNAQVATVYANLWNPSGVTKNTYVQAFAVALGIYADTSTLGFNDTAKKFGFVIAPGGGAAATFNVGDNGAAFGVANGTTLTVLQILQAANDNFNPTTGLFYGGDQTLTSDLNNVLNGINTKGDIS